MSQHIGPLHFVLKILAGLALLSFLYLGRSVFEPITLAVMLGFVMTPIVRQIRRLGLGQPAAAMSALTLVGMMSAGIALATCHLGPTCMWAPTIALARHFGNGGLLWVLRSLPAVHEVAGEAVQAF